MTGVALALAIAPGKRTDWDDPSTCEDVSNIAPPMSTQDALFDLFRYSPVGIACLIAARLLEVVDLWRALSALGSYMATVISGFLIQMFFVQPLIYMLLTRKNPLTFMKGLLQVWVTAFVTSSSAATLAMNIECCEENLTIDRRITHFVLPFGTTVNMNGAALYEAVSAIFIAQLTKGYNLTVTRIVIISLTAIITSVGAAPVPSAVAFPLTVVLGSVGLDTTHVATTLALDWILDRICTSLNVVNDGFCAGIVDHYCKDSLTMANSIAQLSLADALADQNGATKMWSQGSEYGDSGRSMVKTIDPNGDMKDKIADSPLRCRHGAFGRNSDGNNGISDTPH